MHLRIQKVKKGQKTYRYAQLAQSVRRKSDGMPTHRIIAHLGRLNDEEIVNFRAALEANRQGKQVRIKDSLASRMSEQIVRSSLAWLDIAVLMRLIDDLGLHQLLDDLMPVDDADVHPADVISALVIHRLICPGSKIQAIHWFGETALPQLFDINVASFNNSRIHRVLKRLAAVQPQLEAGLASLYLDHQQAFATLFVDVTDTWFCGLGPDLAEKGKTKEGMYRRKLNILLVCNEDGLPLNWEVLPGNQNDGIAIDTAIAELSQHRWASQIPVVCDRAVGKPAYVQSFLNQGVRFLTAMTVTEIERFTNAIPTDCFQSIDVGQLDESLEPYTSTVAAAAEQAGFKPVDNDLYVLDLGLVTLDDHRQAADGAHHNSGSESTMAADAIRLGWRLKRDRERGVASSYAKLARRYQISSTRAYMRVGLLRVADDILDEVVNNQVSISIRALERLSQIEDEDKQRRQFRQILANPSARVATHPPGDDGPVDDGLDRRLRAVAYFSPENLVARRRRAHDQCREVRDYVEQLNHRLSGPGASLSSHQIMAGIDRKLRKFSFISLFDVDIDVDHDDRPCRIELIRDDHQWHTRRKYDGITLLIAHPDLLQSAAELCRLYRAKTTVEKDFRIIKSVVELRPVFHRRDAKVQAHVSICMLALLLERTLRRQLAQTPLQHHDPVTVLRRLASCRLNRIQLDPTTEHFLSITRPNPDQQEILHHLGMIELADDEILPKIGPRQ